MAKSNKNHGPRLWHVTLTWKYNTCTAKKEFFIGAETQDDVLHIVKTRMADNTSLDSATARVRDMGRLQAPLTYFSSDTVLYSVYENHTTTLQNDLQIRIAILWGRALESAVLANDTKRVQKLKDEVQQKNKILQWSEECVEQGILNIDAFFMQKINAYIKSPNVTPSKIQPQSFSTKMTVITETCQPVQQEPVTQQAAPASQTTSTPEVGPTAEPAVEPTVSDTQISFSNQAEQPITPPDSMFEDRDDEEDDDTDYGPSIPEEELNQLPNEAPEEAFPMLDTENSQSSGEQQPEQPEQSVSNPQATKESSDEPDEPEYEIETNLDEIPDDNIIDPDAYIQPAHSPVPAASVTPKSIIINPENSEAEQRRFMIAALSQCQPDMLRHILKELQCQLPGIAKGNRKVVIKGNALQTFRIHYETRYTFKSSDELCSCMAQFIAEKCEPINGKTALYHAYKNYVAYADDDSDSLLT